MDDSSSDSSAPIASPTVASVLGIKGSLRFRRHGASQKAHVVLRRVEVSETSSYGNGKTSVAYFSLFAQKRIEVKPGKEILLAVASEDGTFTDQAVMFEGDLSSAFDSNSEEEEEVEKQIAQDDIVPDSPSTHVVPPKMRRTWTKQFEQVSSVAGEQTFTTLSYIYIRGFGISSLDTFLPPPPTHISVGIQAQPSWSMSSVQAVPPASPLQEKPTISAVESTIELPTATRLAQTLESEFPQKLAPPPDDFPVSVLYKSIDDILRYSRYRIMIGRAVFHP